MPSELDFMVRIYDLSDLIPDPELAPNPPTPAPVYHICGGKVVAVPNPKKKTAYDCRIICYGPPDAPQKTVRDYWTNKLVVAPCAEWQFTTTLWEMSTHELSQYFFRLPNQKEEIYKLVSDPKTSYSYTRPATPLEQLQYYRKGIAHQKEQDPE